jgi:tRNA1(Val) A37 N6-methylase TrmN6
MFSADFFPTPQNVIEQILTGEDLTGKTVLEPSAGKGNIVDFCAGSGASVIACENNTDLKKILQTKCKVIAEDFLTVTSDQVSHIDFIVMNPPFLSR